TPIPPRHAADAGADRRNGEHFDDRRLFPALRRALCDDARGTAAKHGQRALFHVRGRLQVVEPRFGLGGGLHPVSVHLRRDRGPGPRCTPRLRIMTPGLARVIVNGLLFGIAAVTLFPLVWMVAVSLMSAGEVSTYPPPLVPSHPAF